MNITIRQQFFYTLLYVLWGSMKRLYWRTASTFMQLP